MTPSAARTSARASGCCRRCHRCGANWWASGSRPVPHRIWPRHSSCCRTSSGCGRSTGRHRRPAQRLHAYAEKAIREAGTTPPGTTPTRLRISRARLAGRRFRRPRRQGIDPLVKRLDSYGHDDTLGQKLIQLTAPGIPDVYQGTESGTTTSSTRTTADPSTTPRIAMCCGRSNIRKIRVTSAALRLRRERPETFLSGGHRPVLARGDGSEHVVAFVAATTSWWPSAGGRSG